jgi:hypothetical protein
MGFFRDIRITMADKKVQKVIASYLNNLEALPTSREFGRSVEKLISIFWADSKKRKACEEKGFRKEDLCYLFIVMVIAVLPNPVIQGGGPLLAATLPFIEFHRLEAVMDAVNVETSGIQNPEERKRVIAEHARILADLIYNSHLNARGPAKLIGQPSARIISQVAAGKFPETIINKEDTDLIFSLNKPQWEAYAKRMVHPEGWQVRLSPHESGTGVMSYNPKTGLGLSIQPLYGNDTSPPDMLVVGSDFPAGTLPKFTDELKRRMEADAGRDLGPEYSVSARYTALAPSIEGIELTVMKVKP